jgi:hypothetical protein
MPRLKPKEEEEQNQQGYGYEDERQPKSEAVRYLGEVPRQHDLRMARTRLSRLQVITLTMQETQEEILNSRREHRMASKTWRHTLARNLYALGGGWREEMKSILEMQAEANAGEIAMRE